MSTSDQRERRIVPPAVGAPEARAGMTYTPPKYVPTGYSRGRRNLLVWGLCAVIIIVAVVLFVNLMLPSEMREMLRYVK